MSQSTAPENLPRRKVHGLQVDFEKWLQNEMAKIQNKDKPETFSLINSASMLAWW